MNTLCVTQLTGTEITRNCCCGLHTRLLQLYGGKLSPKVLLGVLEKEANQDVCFEKMRMLARFQPPRSRLESYQGADTILSGLCAENYRLALHERSKDRHMLSPVWSRNISNMHNAAATNEPHFHAPQPTPDRQWWTSAAALVSKAALLDFNICCQEI